MEVTTEETDTQAERESERHLTLSLCACMYVCVRQKMHTATTATVTATKNETEPATQNKRQLFYLCNEMIRRMETNAGGRQQRYIPTNRWYLFKISFVFIFYIQMYTIFFLFAFARPSFHFWYFGRYVPVSMPLSIKLFNKFISRFPLLICDSDK